MRTRLEEFTLAEFVELMCGDYSCLGEGLPPEETVINVRNIIMEYRAIVDPNGSRAFLIDAGDLNTAKNDVLFFSICDMLLEMDREESVRELLEEKGIRVGNMPFSRLRATVKSKLGKATATLKRLTEEMKNSITQEGDVRKDFDRQTAAMMAHFKFQIDPDTIKASIYAHLLARLQRDIKAHQEALKKMR